MCIFAKLAGAKRGHQTPPTSARPVDSTAVTMAEVRARRLTILGDDVFDLSAFFAKHPGGDEIKQLVGMDATLPFINAHGIAGALPTLPKKYRVGHIEESTLDGADRDLRALWRSYQARGLFTYQPRWLLVDAARGLGLFALAALALLVSSVVAYALFSVALLNVMWWVHDACHDSIFAARKQARRWAEAASVIFVGTPVLDYQYVMHRIHHGYTNVLGADQALETGPVIWDESMRARTVAALLPWQAWLWFGVVLPLTFPLFLSMAVHGQLRRGRYGKLLLVAARWALAALLFRHHPLVLVGATLTAGYLLALVSSLNHFHKPMAARLDPHFARSVAEVTQNLTHQGALCTWLTGGLNFHIEHHLFATMPRHNYRLIAADVRALFRRHGLAYSTCTLAEALGALGHKLNAPLDGNLLLGGPVLD